MTLFLNCNYSFFYTIHKNLSFAFSKKIIWKSALKIYLVDIWFYLGQNFQGCIFLPLSLELTKVILIFTMEKEMATYFSILVWEIPLIEAPGGLQSMGSQRIWHDTTIKQPQHVHKLPSSSAWKAKSSTGRWFQMINSFLWNLFSLECCLCVCVCVCVCVSFIFIRWRLITLQYCSGFCHTLTWISHRFTCIPHPEFHENSIETCILSRVKQITSPGWRNAAF